MAPFIPPSVIVTGFKERIDTLTVQGDRLYVGTSTGNLHIYNIDETPEGEHVASVVEVKKGLTRKSIEQLGFIKDINSLVVLSESQVALYPLPGLSPPTVLLKAKVAFSFAIHTGVQHVLPDGKVQQPTDGDFGRTKSIPTAVTQLVVGCRRKVVIYSWKDGEVQEAKEVPLPHSPRVMAFLDHRSIGFAYTATEHAIFSLETFTATDLIIPVASTSSVTGMSALTGLTGYMTLGLGPKPKPIAVRISDTEVMVAKDNEGIFIGADSKVSRTSNIGWPAPPEDVAFLKPYVFSIMPPGTVSTAVLGETKTVSSSAPIQPSSIPSAVVQITSSLSLLPIQTTVLPSPPASSPSPSTSAHCTARLLTPSPSAKSPLFLVTTPTDRATATAEGSSLWRFQMRSWTEQIDELVLEGSYADALALLEIIDQAVLPDKDRRRSSIRALHAVSQFRSGKFDDAINTFIELDLNPAKVVALYPESVSGRLSVPRETWITLHGGPAPVQERPPSAPPSEPGKSESQEDLSEADVQTQPQTQAQAQAPERPATPQESIRQKIKSGLGALVPSNSKDEETASLSGRPKQVPDEFQRSVETLLRYLTDRRPKIAGALAAVHITPTQSHQLAFLSDTSTQDLFALPNAPLSLLTPEQLLREAQIVDTVLFKSYLLTRPVMLGPLCRVPNWCEVSEVEEELRAHEKFAELIFLYNGKKMHSKALELLKQLSEKETSTRDKLAPSISYLQKLGPEHLLQIFESARWIFDQDKDMAFEIFTSEDVELPRWPVADYLESIDPTLCSRYLEHLIDERGEESSSYHDRLAELYLSMTLAAKRRGNEDVQKAMYAKLLQFIDTTNHYRPDRLYGFVSSEDLYEARAILLGRLGRHDQALELHVYRLQDYAKAEQYCTRIYQPNTPTSTVYLTLLRTYLRPTPSSHSPTSSKSPFTADLLTPALALIARHGPRLDAIETLHLLPPLVRASDVRTFLLAALRAPVRDTRVVREINKAQTESVARRLVGMEARRVKVVDSRICPQCHKRIGNSVIAVHAPRGEVTHYQCREAFSLKLKETRH